MAVDESTGRCESTKTYPPSSVISVRFREFALLQECLETGSR